MLVLHGLLGSSRNWQTTGRDLAAHFHVLALDARNHGRSPHSEEMSFAAMADDVIAWMDARDLARADIVGHSMGGKTAMLLACRHPGRVARLVVVDVAPRNYSWTGHRNEFLAMNELNLAQLTSRAEAEERFAARVPDLGMRKFLATNLERDAEAEKTTGGDQDQAQQLVSGEIQAKLKEILGADIAFRRTDVVGATVSGELIKKGVFAVLGSIILIILYVWFRYRWQFGVGAIVATVHDTIMTLGMLSVLQVPFDIPMIAAILTVVGYSVNDTVVVFDRMRENLRKYKKMPFGELIDLSINETLSRTVMTSGTVIISLVPLFFFGGEVLRGFSAAILFGVFVGTYSSIFIAAPFLMATGVTRDWSKVKGAATAGA